MNKIILLTAVLGGYLLALPLSLFSEELSLQDVSNDITWNREIKKALLLFEEGFDGRVLQKIDESISQLAKIRKSLQTENLSFVTEFLLEKGEALFISGDRKLGVHILEEVKAAFPSDYRPHLKLSKIYLSLSGFRPFAGISRLWEGIGIYLSSDTRKENLGNFVFQVFLMNITITGYLVVLVFFAKHAREAFFDLARIFHLPQRSSVFMLTAIGFFMIPLWIGGFIGLIVTFSFMLWPYLKNLKERCFVLGFTLLIVGLPLFHTKELRSFTPDRSYAALKLEEFSRNSWDRETLSVLDKQREENGDSVWLSVAKGLVLKWNGEANKSYEVFSQLLKKFPDNPDVLINLGNYSVTTGQLKDAKEYYEHALSINPNIAEARYNLSITLDGLLDFDPAKEEFDRAYSLDGKKIQDFLDMSKDHVGLAIPIDKMPTGSPPSPTEKIHANGSVITALNILSAAVKKENIAPIFAALAMYLLIFLVLRQKLVAKPIEECDVCGTIFYSGSTCRVCTALMLPHSRVEPLERKRVIEDLGNYQFLKKIFPIFFNLLGPGSGLIFKDSIFTGALVLWGYWMLFLLALLTYLGANTPISTEITVFLLIMYYLLTNVYLYRAR